MPSASASAGRSADCEHGGVDCRSAVAKPATQPLRVEVGRDLGIVERPDERLGALTQVVELRILRQAFKASSFDRRVMLRQLVGRNDRIMRDEVIERRRRNEPLVPGADPARQDSAELQRALELEERGLQGAVVGVDEAEMDLALVPKAGSVEGSWILIDQRDLTPRSASSSAIPAPCRPAPRTATSAR